MGRQGEATGPGQPHSTNCPHSSECTSPASVDVHSCEHARAPYPEGRAISPGTVLRLSR